MITFIRKPIFHLLLILSLGILGYSNTFNAPFHFDDEGAIIKNPIIKNLDYYKNPSEATIHRAPQEYPLLINRYIGSLTFALNYKMHGLDVTGYHVVNIVIHLINSWLVYWLVYQIFITLSREEDRENNHLLKHGSLVAFFTSLLFVTHPIQTQAVTYIVQRFASLATMFYLLSINMFVWFRLTLDSAKDNIDEGKISTLTIVSYFVALIATVLAMKTKEIAFTLPLTIVLYELIFFRRDPKSRILYLTPFILTMFIIPATLLYVVDLGGGVGTATRLVTDMTRPVYLFTQFRVIMTYIRLLFFPVHQNLDYDYPIYHSIFDFEVFLPLIFIFILCFVVVYSFWRFRKTNPLTRVVFFGTAWFFVTLSIESSIIPIVDVIFEHRMYLPSFGVFLIFSTLISIIIGKCRGGWVESVAILSVLITVLGLTGATYSRNHVWGDKILLWQSVVNESPGKARGYVHLGIAHFERGNYDMAINNYKKAIYLAPSRSSKAYSNLGNVYGTLGRDNEAIKAYSQAVRINPSNDSAHVGLGTIMIRIGLIRDGISEFKKAKKANPYNVKAYNNLGVTFGRLGRTREAIDEFMAALRIKPNSTDINNNLKVALNERDRTR